MSKISRVWSIALVWPAHRIGMEMRFSWMRNFYKRLRCKRLPTISSLRNSNNKNYSAFSCLCLCLSLWISPERLSCLMWNIETLFPGQRACERVSSLLKCIGESKNENVSVFRCFKSECFPCTRDNAEKMIESPFPHRILIARRQRQSIFHIQFELDTSVCRCCCELWLAIASISSAHKARDKDEKRPQWFNEYAAYTTRT